jgi:hypothetical protein
MQVEQKRLAVLDEAIGISKVGLALANGLDFGPAQGNAGFEFLQEKVVVAGVAVVRCVAFARGRAPSAERLRDWFGVPLRGVLESPS